MTKSRQEPGGRLLVRRQEAGGKLSLARITSCSVLQLENSKTLLSQKVRNGVTAQCSSVICLLAILRMIKVERAVVSTHVSYLS